MGRVSRCKVNGIKNGSILFKVLLFAGIPLAIAGIAGGGILAYNATVKSEAVAQIKTEVAVTYGTPLTIDLILNEGADRENCSFASDVSAINTDDGKLTCKGGADSFDCYEYVDIKTLV